MKKYHVYDENELEEYCEPADVAESREEYMMILATWRSGPYGGSIRGTVAYPNMLNALEHIREEVEEIQGFMGPEEAEKRYTAIDAAMEQIKDKKSDEGLEFPEVGFEQPGVGVMCYAQGYWDAAVPKMIEYMKRDPIYIERYLEEEYEDAEEEEVEEDFEKKAEELAASFDINEYLKGKDMDSNEFFDEFIELCNDYNEKLNA